MNSNAKMRVNGPKGRFRALVKFSSKQLLRHEVYAAEQIVQIEQNQQAVIELADAAYIFEPMPATTGGGSRPCFRECAAPRTRHIHQEADNLVFQLHDHNTRIAVLIQGRLVEAGAHIDDRNDLAARRFMTPSINSGARGGTMVICIIRIISCTARISTPNSSSPMRNVTSWIRSSSCGSWLLPIAGV